MRCKIECAVAHCRGLYQLLDIDLPYWSTSIRDCRIIGVGIAGALVASSIAATSGKSASFVRLKKKEHGLPSIWDGQVSEGQGKYVVFCADADLLYTEEWLQSGVVKSGDCERIIGVDVLDVDTLSLRRALSPQRHAEIGCSATVINHTKYFRTLTGRTFTLSSGALSDVYVETLPAAYAYDLVSSALDSVLEKYRDAVFVGLAYGGIYLSAVSNIKSGVCPACVDPNAFNGRVFGDRGKVVLIDDFVSTGKSFRSAARFLGSTDLSKLSLSAKAGLCTDSIEVIYRL